MSLSQALFASVTGLETSSTAIAVIGDNIANVATPGFKERRVEFADILGQSLATGGTFSQTGSGARVVNIRRLDSQGTFESTGRVTDLAIEGRGLFVLDTPQGARIYTRAGLFGFDNQGQLVDKDGAFVQGFTIDPVSGLSTGALANVQLDIGLSPPRSTALVDISTNLDSNAPIVGAFDPSLPDASSNFRTVVTLFDSLGNGHSTSIFFSKTASNAWDWTAAVDPADTTTAVATAGDNFVVQGGGNMTFDSAGIMQTFTGSPITFNFSGGAAAAQVVALNLGPVAGVGIGEPTTQFAAASSINSTNQDGFSAGNLQSLNIDPNGFLVGNFSNGEARTLAQIALAQFANVEGMDAIGNSNLIATRVSGQPLIGEPKTGQFGALRASNFEQSNVDLADQFVRLILNQRAFQANTRTVSVTNELLGLVVQLGQ